MQTCSAVADLRPLRRQLPPPVALVPTMGALHAGHLALIAAARRHAGAAGSVVVSLFVNPTQFGPGEDLSRYPRPFDADRQACRDAGVDLLFAPPADQVYPPDHSTSVRETALSQGLCGARRPGHFDGVCTIVLKLFNLVQPDLAVFGRKDFQQLAVVRRMVRDLDVPVTIVGVDTVREPDGLALSSRNAYLSPGQRRQATALRQALLAARQHFLDHPGHATDDDGDDHSDRSGPAADGLLQAATAVLRRQAPDAGIDYLELVDRDTLQPRARANRRSVLLGAIRLGSTRLIDNLELDPAAAPNPPATNLQPVHEAL